MAHLLEVMIPMLVIALPLLAPLLATAESNSCVIHDVDNSAMLMVKTSANDSASTERKQLYTNPILRGSYPDPSIVRVGDDYYMASSSFEYFPGIPIHHSEDLVNWNLIGYGLHSADQISQDGVNLIDVNQEDGVQAPTIRYKNGTFYIVATTAYNPPDGGEGRLTSFVITATNPRGPWSQPHLIKEAVGIDPSLFFDDDGKVWYTANHGAKHPEWDGQAVIWLQEIDLVSFKLFGRRYRLTKGACQGVWVEGPHIYKYNNTYYLITAEGGTGPHHAVMADMSSNITGPYSPDPRNPVLSMRQTSYSSWVTRVGHADLLELKDGRWIMVALGVRSESLQEMGPGTLVGSSNMGRESHLIPMRWESDAVDGNSDMWPVASPETGTLNRQYHVPLAGTKFKPVNTFADTFNKAKLDLEWNFRRLPANDTYSLRARKGFLRLYARPQVIAKNTNCSLLGIRQWESAFDYQVGMEFSARHADVEAGMMLFQKDDAYVKFTVVRGDKSWNLQIVYATQDKEPAVLANTTLVGYEGKILLHVEANTKGYHYRYSLPTQKEKHVLTTKRDLLLYVGYTGNYLGLYATSNGQNTRAYADFEWVKHVALPRPPKLPADLESYGGKTY